jgi:hypothetical protein
LSADTAEQKVLHESLLHVQPVLAPARPCRAFTSLRDVSLHRNRLPALSRRRIGFGYGTALRAVTSRAM